MNRIIEFLFPWTSLEKGDFGVMTALTLAMDAFMWFIAIVTCPVWIPMLFVYLIAKAIAKAFDK